MANARAYSLAEQRKANSTTLGGGRIRILTPYNNSVASIARSNFKAELNDNVQKYNDGVISNADMKTFLTDSLNNPGLSAADKTDLQNQIRDFDIRIVGDRLQARYEATQPNTIERIQAAKDLSAFYGQRAASLSEGTPAQSIALQNKASWDQKVQNETDNMNKYARSLSRAQAEEKINTIPSGTSANSEAKAKMYQDLADQAAQDGDTLGAQKYQATAQSYLTQSQVQADSEAKRAESELQKANKKDLVDLMNSLANDYHDGKINEDQYMFALSKIEPRINTLGDTSLALTFNRTVDTVQKNIEKGGMNTTLNQWGLPVKTGFGTQTAPKESVQDFQYSENLKTAQQMLSEGKISAETFTQGVGELIQQHQQDLQSRADMVQKIAQENPNTYIQYNGKKQRAVDVLDQVQKEMDSIQNDFNAVQSGNAKLLMVPPDQFNSSGKITKSGKDYATYRLVDPNNIPENMKDQFVADEYGNLHPVTRQQINIQPSEDLQGYTKEGNKVYYDQSGNPYIFGNQQADIYQPGTNKKVTVPAVPGSPVPSYEQASGARGLSAPTNPATLAQNSSLATYTPTPELQQTVLPKPSNFEGMIEQPKPVNLDITKPIPGLDIMPKLPDQKTTQAQPTYSPAPTPTPAVNLDLSKPQPGLTIQKPAQVASPVQNLATSIGNALSQSPFSYLKKKLFG